MNEVIVAEEEIYGLKPLIREYCTQPDLEHEEGWMIQENKDDEDKCISFFKPPTNGYVRSPPTLNAFLQNDTGHYLVGRTIVALHTTLGRYGMGGCGWIGLEFAPETSQPQLMLVYCLWSANDWVHVKQQIHAWPSFQDQSNLRWKVTDVQLTERSLIWTCTDLDTQRTVSITANEVPAKELRRHNPPTWAQLARVSYAADAPLYHMGALWHACRPDSTYWCKC